MDLTEERNARFLALFQPIQSDCERWALRLTGNLVDAQDILQQSILNALAKFHQLRDEAKFKWWMFSIIKTTFNLSLRSGKRMAEPVDPETLAWQRDTRPGFAEEGTKARAVQECLRQLSPEQQQALWLFEVDGFSSQEIASLLGKNDNAVRVLLKRSRDRLKTLLDSAGVGLD